MDKILDMLTEIEAEVYWSIGDGDGSEKIMALIHRAMDIAVKGKTHKWPEEKPPISGSWYLVFIDREYTSLIDILFWGGNDWMRFSPNRNNFVFETGVTHWWNLPEVTE